MIMSKCLEGRAVPMPVQYTVGSPACDVLVLIVISVSVHTFASVTRSPKISMKRSLLSRCDLISRRIFLGWSTPEPARQILMLGSCSMAVMVCATLQYVVFAAPRHARTIPS